MTDTYVWEWNGETADEIDSFALLNANITIDEIVAKFKEEAYNQAVNGFTNEATTQGVTYNIISAESDAGYTERDQPVYFGEIQTRVQPYYKLWAKIKVTFTSDRPLMGSPLDPITVAIIAKIITALVTIVIAYFAIQAINNWMNSITTNHSVITKVTQSTNPDGSTTTTTTTEDTTTPNLGSLALGSGLIILVVVIVLAFMFFGGKGGGTTMIKGGD